MKIFKNYLGIISIVALLFSSCGTKVDKNATPAKSLSSYSSYSFLPNRDTIQTSSFDNALVNELVIDQIREKMDENNYRLDRNQPDILVHYHLMLDEEMAANSNPVYTNYTYFRPGYFVGPYYQNYVYNNYFTIPRISGSDIKQVPYKEGTMVIDFIDRRTNEIIWRETATEKITPRNFREQIKSNVNAIFSRLPK